MTGRLIAFTGPAGSGKSTAADALVEVGWTRVKFADPLKDMVRAFYRACGIDHPPYIEARIEGDLKEEPDPFLRGQTPRWAMQTLGTEWGRNLIAEDIWTEAFIQRAGSLMSRDVDVVVDDCRFENEAEAIARLGGRVVRILGRDGGLGMSHASERDQVACDMKIANTQSLAGFQRDIVHIFHRVCP